MLDRWGSIRPRTPQDPMGQTPGRMKGWVQGPFIFLELINWQAINPIANYHDGMNLYQYSRSMPLVRFDPYGLSSKEDCEECGGFWGPKPGPPAPPNGCGSGFPPIPDDPTGGCSFASPCNTHDSCYGDCYSSKKSCDDGFLQDMQSECDKCYSRGELSNLYMYYRCRMFASIYAAAVRNLGGGAYDDAQDENCECHDSI